MWKESAKILPHMSRFFVLCRTNKRKHGLKDQPMQFNTVHNSGSFCFILSVFLICLIFIAAGFYVFNITAASTAGFKISDKQDKITELKLANESLKERTEALGSLDYIKNKANELGLVNSAQTSFLEDNSTGVAMK